jgi:hypothetical protein
VIDPQLTAVLGDCLHNYRSALDHLVAALRRIENQPDDKASQWPVETDERRWTKTARRQLAGVSSVGLDAVRSLQPFEGWDLAQVLCALSDLDNTDKHRRLTVAAWTPRSLGTGGVPSDGLRWHKGEIKPGFVLVEHRAQPGEVHVDAQAEVSLVERGQRTHVRDVLWEVDFTVRTAITTVIRAYDSSFLEPLTGVAAPSGYQQGRLPT